MDAPLCLYGSSATNEDSKPLMLSHHSSSYQVLWLPRDEAPKSDPGRYVANKWLRGTTSALPPRDT